MNKNTEIIVIIVIVVLLLVVALTFAVSSLTRAIMKPQVNTDDEVPHDLKNPYAYYELEEFKMMLRNINDSGFILTSVKKVDDNTATIEVKNTTSEADPGMCLEEYTVPATIMYDLYDLFGKYSLVGYPEYTKGKLGVDQNGYKTAYAFVFKDDQVVEFKDFPDMPGEAMRAVVDLEDLVAGYIEQAKEPVPQGNLKEYYYSEGGGMNGGSEILTISLQADDTVKVEYSYQETHDADEINEEYVTSRELLDKIAQVYEENNISKWNKLPNSEFYALDAPTSYYRFTTTDSKEVSFDTNKEFPEGGNRAIRLIHQITNKFIEDKQKETKGE